MHILMAALIGLQGAGTLPATADAIAAIEADPALWRRVDPENLMVMEFGGRRVLIELAPHFAPQAVDNIRKLVRAGYYDSTAIVRVQDNYVVQWGAEEEDVQSGDTGAARNRGEALDRVPGELSRPRRDDDFTVIDQRDVYAPIVGFSRGFAAAEDGRSQWLTHCYGAVGVGRADDVDGADGSSLYVVTGAPPRHLDLNIVLVGRVIDGMPAFHALSAGSGPMGFYEGSEAKPPLHRTVMAADLPAGERETFAAEVARTDTPAFLDFVGARANRARDGWFIRSAGAVDLCNIPVPVRFPGREEKLD